MVRIYAVSIGVRSDVDEDVYLDLDVGSSETAQYIVFDTLTYKRDFDFDQALHDALMDYLEVDDCRQFRGKDISILDFARYVPNIFCLNRGFNKSLVSADEIPNSADRFVATRCDVECHLRELAREQGKPYAPYVKRY